MNVFFGLLALGATSLLYFTWEGVGDLRERVAVVETKLDNISDDIKELGTGLADMREVIDKIDKRQASLTPNLRPADWQGLVKAEGGIVVEYDTTAMQGFIAKGTIVSDGIWVVGTEPEAVQAIEAGYGPK